MAKHLTSFAAIAAPVGAPLTAIGDEICKAMDAAMVRDGYVIKAVVPHVVPHGGVDAATSSLSVTAGYLVLGVLAERDGDHGPLGPGMVMPVA
jgi:hypothetical protein